MTYNGESLSGVSNAFSTTFSSRLTRAFNRVAQFAKILPMEPAVGQGGGKQIGWDVEVSGAAAASFAEGSDIGTTEWATDPVLPATLPFGQYRSAFQLSNLEVKAAMASPAQAAELGRIYAERLRGSLSKIASVANADLFTGTGTDGSSNPNLIGFDAAVAATGTYAGISKGTYAEWAGNVLANGGTPRPLTMDLLYNLEQLIFVASGMEFDAIVCSAGVARKYAGLFESNVRVVQDGGKPLESYQGGVSGGMFWKGRPVIRDRNAPAGTLRMVKLSEIAIRPLTTESNDDGMLDGQVDAPSTNGEQSEPSGLICDVFPIGRTGSSVKFVAETYLQLQVKRPNAHGLLQDLSEV